jgi:hypothetical protein
MSLLESFNFTVLYTWIRSYLPATFAYEVFITEVRRILNHINNTGKSYSNQCQLIYNWSHILTLQQKDWDCGVACLYMVLKWSDFHSIKKVNLSLIDNHEICRRETPLWSLDLFLFLVELDLNVSMYTTSLGVQSHHLSYEWYNNSSVELDKLRLDKQIAYSKTKGLNIYEVKSFLFLVVILAGSFFLICWVSLL